MESEADRSKYTTACDINERVLKCILDQIQNGEVHIEKLSAIGNEMIKAELQLVYKREKNKFMAFPVSISINNCVGNYIYETGNDKYNTIKDGDTFKIQFGVNIGGCISMCGDTYVYNSGSNSSGNRVIKAETDTLFQNLKKICEKNMYHSNTNDVLRQELEIECSKYGFKPLENNASYQGIKDHLSYSESKYVLLNHKKESDIDGNVMSHPNDCFEFEENEVYHINIQIIKDECDVACTQKHQPHMYRLNEYYHNFKTKSGREFYNKVKNECGTNAFVYSSFDNFSYCKMGKRECMNGGILDEFPVYYLKQKDESVYTICFTVIVGKRVGYIMTK